MASAEKLRVGLCGTGLKAYWAQFAGLEQQLRGYVEQVAGKLAAADVELTDLGLIDTPQAGYEAGHAFRRADSDIIFLYVTTYALSSIVLPVARIAGVPIIVLNLQPAAAIDYRAFNKLQDRVAMTGRWLAYCSACPVPEIANVLTRAGLPFHQVTGVLGEEYVWTEIEEWLAAARAKAALAANRLGLLGHYYSGMLDVMTDTTQVAISFGTHLEVLEVDSISALRELVSAEEIEQRVEVFREHFEVDAECKQEELERAARTAIALDRFVAENDVHSLAYYYEGTGVAVNEDTMSSIILGTSMLTARHVPVAGEYEVKNAIAMKIMDSLGAGGSFTEFYAVDFAADIVLMGHDGPGHTGIAEGKVKVRPLRTYHGKVGRGLSVEMSVKHGPVTLLSVVEDGAAGFKLLAAEGVCEPGEILEIGNTNSRYRFNGGARRFIENWNAQGPAHHCAVGIGHVATKLEKVAKLTGIPYVRVC